MQSIRNKKKMKQSTFNMEEVVMGRIYSMEKKQIILQLIKYILLIGTFIVLCIPYTLLALSLINENKSLDLLTLFTQDTQTGMGLW